MENYEQLLDRLDDLLVDLGLPSKTTNRFSQILMSDLNKNFEEDPLNIFSDFYDLKHILDHAHYFNKILLGESIKKMIKGNLHRRKNENSKPRDFQSELVAAALFQKGGLTVSLGDVHPDFVVSTPYINYGFEVKRISSLDPDKAIKRTKDAAGQLKKYYLDRGIETRMGVIYLSVENHLDNDAHVWTVANFEVARMKVTRDIEMFMDRHKRLGTDRDILKDKNVCGIIINYNQPYFDVSLQQYRIYSRYEYIANKAFWQSILYITPQFMRDIYRPLSLSSRYDRERVLEKDRSNMRDSNIESFVDASYVLSCSSLSTFDSEVEANEHVEKFIQDASKGYYCYKCSKWHIRGPDTIMFSPEDFNRLFKS